MVFMVGMLPLCTFAKSTLAPNYGFKAGFESFQWKEFEGGERLLKESGLRFSIGGNLGNDLMREQGFIYDIDGKLYLGRVNYDGQTQSGQPAKTDTEYN